MNNAISRRSLLRLGAGALGLLGAGSRLSRLGMLNAATNAASTDYKALICIFLFGGNDANNLIVPMSSQGYADYSAVRGGAIALAQSALKPVATVTGNVPYGFHPNLAPFQQLFNLKKLAVVANVGMLVRPITVQQYQQGTGPVPMNLFSHSDQQSQWQIAPSSNPARTGWGGRAADVIAAVNAPSTFPAGVSTAGNSLFLTGQNSTPATVTNGGLGLAGSDGSPLANARDNAFQQILTFKSGLSLVQRGSDITSEGIRVGQVLNSTLNGVSPLVTQFPNTGLGQQMSEVARIIKVRAALGMNRQIFFVSQGGYDTHTDEINSQIGLYDELSQAIQAMHAATVELGVESQVTTFTESEFGRTFQPSSGNGSDHAWGSHHIVMGGAVNGGDLYGKFPTLHLSGPDDVSGRGVWLPSTSLDQYGATLASWFGVPDTSLTTVFPNLTNFQPATWKLGFV